MLLDAATRKSKSAWAKLARMRSPEKQVETRGTILLGSSFLRGKDVWLGRDEVENGTLVVGSDPAQRQDVLASMATNALCWGSGFMFVSGTGGMAAHAMAHALCRKFGREGDLQVLNFMHGLPWDRDGIRRYVPSNTFNPFAQSRSCDLVSIVMSLLDPNEIDPMLKGQIHMMLTAVMGALCFLRDAEGMALDVGVVRDHIRLPAILDLADEETHPNLIPMLRKRLREYLSSLPQYKDGRGVGQSQTTLDAHGVAEMQLTKPFGCMADVYGHVFLPRSNRGSQGDVSMADVVRNRRVLIVLLPKLREPFGEHAALGRFVLASLKVAAGETLGSGANPMTDYLYQWPDPRPEPPFLALFDQVGDYAVPNFAYMLAAYRDLRVAPVYASDSLASLNYTNDSEGQSIVANVRTTITLGHKSGLTRGDADVLRDKRPARVQSSLAGKADRTFSVPRTMDVVKEHAASWGEDVARPLALDVEVAAP